MADLLMPTGARNQTVAHPEPLCEADILGKARDLGFVKGVFGS
jgi:hypothetical protein